MQRADSLEKTLMLGKIEGRRRREWQRMRWLYHITDSVDMSLSKLWEMVKDREALHVAVHGVADVRHDWVTEQQQRNQRNSSRSPEVRFKEPQTFISLPKTRLKEYRSCTHPNLISKPSLKLIAIKLPTKSPWVGIHSFHAQHGADSNGSLVAKMIKNLPAIYETWVWSWVWKIPWRREWQAPPVFLLGEFHKQRILVGYNPCGCKESDRPEQLTYSQWADWGLVPSGSLVLIRWSEVFFTSASLKRVEDWRIPLEIRSSGTLAWGQAPVIPLLPSRHLEFQGRNRSLAGLGLLLLVRIWFILS